MNYADLPTRWTSKLEEFTDAKYGRDYEPRGKLGASDFSNATGVHVRSQMARM